MQKETLIKIPFLHERANPPFEGDDIRYPEGLVRHFLKTHTKKGDRVLDPFAGLGTTLFVAEEMGRTPYGIEADRNRFEWVAGQMQHWQNLRHGDSASIASCGFPKMDFCMTSPPYMPKHHEWNPLFAGNPRHAGYAKYLRRMGLIFEGVATLLKRNATLIVQVDNLRHGHLYTPLVRDLSLVIEKSFSLQNEIIVEWTHPKQGYTHTHCLVFKK